MTAPYARAMTRAATVSPVYRGAAWDIFALGLREMGLTIATIGLYRFWMLTRLRRYFWSSVEIEGEPFEYAGTGLEKLFGFLGAVIALGIYLFAVNLGLTFVGLSYFDGHPAFSLASLLAVAPLLFWAAYRARRYALARTSWRGVRFALEPGAWGYAARAMGYGAVVVASFGLLWPWMQFALTRYRIDRTRFGDLEFRQNGRWAELMPFWTPICLALWAALGAVVWALWSVELVDATGAAAPTLLGAVIGGWLLFLALTGIYSVLSFRYLVSRRVIGGAMRLESALGVRRVARVWLVAIFAFALGALAVAAAMGLTAGLAGAAAMLVLGDAAPPEPEAVQAWLSADPYGQIAVLILAAGFYVLSILAYTSLRLVFVVHMLLGAAVDTLTLAGAASLARARQRPADLAGEAGGFADALGADIGGLI